MIPRCFALVAVALSSIHFAEALPVSSRESQSLADLPTSGDVGLPTSLPIPTVPIPTDVPITSLLPLPTLTDSTLPVSQTSVPISDPLDGIPGSVRSISSADLPLNQDPEGKLGDLSDSTEGSSLLGGVGGGVLGDDVPGSLLGGGLVSGVGSGVLGGVGGGVLGRDVLGGLLGGSDPENLGKLQGHGKGWM
ncbi:uncharacterized protein FOMMEDRAFT_156434 [Fomitiporia mediterranea MF3/22]|uniref:uncharacterized protein n=1 Tax=Fomitiporia mediterranea (strain MF3/22) TaxID=694068 RepID=UPI0004407585|nr:uncharacterized protein FOMMEDRAFT_156434 [Fomitiporia mediterranea MF3/22]EJD03066.1 hypothetical protein FOMMEDRAFT_156434 [Fomitiporia mediterranea MF3/22]